MCLIKKDYFTYFALWKNYCSAVAYLLCYLLNVSHLPCARDTNQTQLAVELNWLTNCLLAEHSAVGGVRAMSLMNALWPSKTFCMHCFLQTLGKKRMLFQVTKLFYRWIMQLSKTSEFLMFLVLLQTKQSQFYSTFGVFNQ